MNIIDAIKSGKPFRRKSWTHEDFFIVDGDDLRYLLTGDRTVLAHVSGILADDWEIQEKTITITESQFDEAAEEVLNIIQGDFKTFLNPQFRDTVKVLLKKRLGF